LDKKHIIKYWQDFFADLFVGTFKNLFLLSFAGLSLGVLTTYLLKEISVQPENWQTWLEVTVLLMALAWYGTFGIVHGLTASLLRTVGKKLCEMVGGLHDLLDILVRGVLSNYPKLNKHVPKKELADKFDQLGKKFLEDLKLKSGFLNLIKSLIFRVVLKVLKFLFLDDVVVELNKKPSDQLSRADIESAVRRVGVEFVISTITDNILLLHVLNGFLLALTFGLPFFLFWTF